MARLLVQSIPLAALILAAPASAQAIFKCTQKGKPPVYQTEPCTAGQRVVKAIAYTPDPNARPYRPDTRSRPYAQRSTAPQGHAIETARNQSACEAAKHARATVFGANNMGGDYETRQRFNDAVMRACY